MNTKEYTLCRVSRILWNSNGFKYPGGTSSFGIIEREIPIESHLAVLGNFVEIKDDVNSLCSVKKWHIDELIE